MSANEVRIHFHPSVHRENRRVRSTDAAKQQDFREVEEGK